ncbi:MAG: gliding motility-associated C-terminal domain-containing protein [Bacteroidales bacterium]|nr:gliding motility-associated C-terminal domain-containing protein [Bacteroidales bacterium]
MNDEEIKRLLENVEVEPSAHCWEAISSNIAAGTGAAATTAAKVAGHALSTTAKVIIGVTSAVAIATTAVILAVTGVFSPKETVVAEPQIVVVEPDPTEEIVPVAEEDAPSVAPVQPAEKTATPASESPSVNTANESPVAAVSESPAPTPKVAAATTTADPAPVPAPQASVTNVPATPAAAPSTPKSAPKPAATSEAVQTSSLTDLSDPVLEDAETLSSIDFAPPVALIIPNVITPNGDGYNDVFIIQGIEKTERNRLIIRNGSGTIVFQTVNYRNDWGAPNLADGTYFYQFVYTLHGIDETRTGTLTIMR